MKEVDCNLPWWRADRPWGFRFSLQDGIIIIAGAVATWIGQRFQTEMLFLIPFVLGHFLLFCNTFRVGGERTLIWIGVFLVNVTGFAVFNNIHWFWILSAQSAFTGVLIVQCVLSRNYHGIACEQINSEGYRKGAKAEGALTRGVLKRIGVPNSVIQILIGRKTKDFED